MGPPYGFLCLWRQDFLGFRYLLTGILGTILGYFLAFFTAALSPRKSHWGRLYFYVLLGERPI